MQACAAGYALTDILSRSASLSRYQAPIWGPRPVFVTVRQLRICWYGAPSLTRGRVCRLQLMLALSSAIILSSDSRGTHDHILLSQIRDSPYLEDQVPVFISPRNRVAQLYLQALGSIFVACTTHRATVEVFDPASTRATDWESQSYITAGGSPPISSSWRREAHPHYTLWPRRWRQHVSPKRRNTAHVARYKYLITELTSS
jgi:hypothetical protein